MTNYVVIRDYGYDGRAIRFAEGDQELYDELTRDTSSDIEYVFIDGSEIDVEFFKTQYVDVCETAREQALAKLTPEEIKILGL